MSVKVFIKARKLEPKTPGYIPCDRNGVPLKSQDILVSKGDLLVIAIFSDQVGQLRFSRKHAGKALTIGECLYGQCPTVHDGHCFPYTQTDDLIEVEVRAGDFDFGYMIRFEMNVKGNWVDAKELDPRIKDRTLSANKLLPALLWFSVGAMVSSIVWFFGAQ